MIFFPAFFCFQCREQIEALAEDMKNNPQNISCQMTVSTLLCSVKDYLKRKTSQFAMVATCHSLSGKFPSEEKLRKSFGTRLPGWSKRWMNVEG